MPRGKKTESQLRSLIVRLRDDEGWSFKQIGDHLKKDKGTIRHIYVCEKSPLVNDSRGRPRKTTER